MRGRPVRPPICGVQRAPERAYDVAAVCAPLTGATANAAHANSIDRLRSAPISWGDKTGHQQAS
eukprot:scaffold2119_cov67-Phaeocystis_antarctica.AAC.1